MKPSQHSYVNTVAVADTFTKIANRDVSNEFCVSGGTQREGGATHCTGYMEAATRRLHLLSPVMATDDEWPIVSASEGALAGSPYEQRNARSLCDLGRLEFVSFIWQMTREDFTVTQRLGRPRRAALCETQTIEGDGGTGEGTKV